LLVFCKNFWNFWFDRLNLIVYKTAKLYNCKKWRTQNACKIFYIIYKRLMKSKSSKLCVANYTIYWLRVFSTKAIFCICVRHWYFVGHNNTSTDFNNIYIHFLFLTSTEKQKLFFSTRKQRRELIICLSPKQKLNVVSFLFIVSFFFLKTPRPAASI